jgi:hypothetical protein
VLVGGTIPSPTSSLCGRFFGAVIANALELLNWD